MAPVAEHHAEHEHITEGHEEGGLQLPVIRKAIGGNERLEGTEQPTMAKQNRYFILASPVREGCPENKPAASYFFQTLVYHRFCVCRDPSRDQDGGLGARKLLSCLDQTALDIYELLDLAQRLLEFGRRFL